jgi:uncharacterized protein YbjQ (UPF0145 family)
MATDDSQRIDGLQRQFGELSSQTVRRSEFREDMKQLKRDLTAHIDKVGGECEEFRDEYRKDRQRALEGSVSKRMIVLAMIAGSATVLASIIGAAAVIITSSPS